MNLSRKLTLRTCLVAYALFSFAMIPAISQGEVTDIGLRYGRSIGDTDFEQYDVSASMELPWQHEFSSKWLLHTGLEGIASILTWGGDTGFKPSLMTNLLLSTPGKKVHLLAGLGFGVMFGDTEFDGDHDLGGPFFLQGQAGLRVSLTDNVFVGYRFYHQSNAGIYSSNDSVNVHQAEMGWAF